MGFKKVAALAAEQPVKRCVIGGDDCPDYFTFDGLGWCVSELFRKPCQMKKG